MTSPERTTSSLPVQLTSFVGRERELAEVGELLRSSRLITLTGAGGSGKTRLALRVARRAAAEHPGGVGWVELAALSDPELIAQEVASALGVREEGGRSVTDALLEVLQHRAPLLVLDNCEHLVEGCAALVDTLLRGAPDLRILATSREALGVAGERAWLVPPLSVPEATSRPAPEKLGDSEAVRLFVERARDALPAFALTAQNAPAVAEICRRLDGIPLALELAAARIRVLSPEQIAERLDRTFDLLTTGSRTALPRHRTLRATMDWSYRLLQPPKQRLLQRLSVFSGGFTLDAAEEVCAGGEVEEVEVLDLLAALVERSLVVVRERDHMVRYELLDTVRQYSRAQWVAAETGEESVLHRRHAAYYLALAEAAYVAMEGYQRFDDWLPRLKLEQDNVRAALSWALEEDPDTALRLVGRLPYFWVPQPVHWGEGLRWTEAALERAPDSSPPADRGQAAWAAGLLALLQQDWPRARKFVEETIRLAEEAGDRRLTVLSLSLLPMVMSVQGEAEAGLPHGEEATRIARELEEPWLVVVALITGIASPRRIGGGLEAAEPALREALELSLEEGYLWGIWESGMHLALLALERADVGEAEELARTAAAASGQMGADWHAARTLVVLASVLAARGDAEKAGRLLGAVEAWLEFTGTRLLPDEEAARRELSAGLGASLGEAELERVRQEGRALELADAIALGTGTEHGRAPDADPGTGGPGAPTTAGAAVPPTAHGPSALGAAPSLASAGHALHVSALGPLEIRLAGAPLDPERWSHAKPKELLLYLLAHPAGRTREQIGLAFWPDASTAQVKNSFHVLLHKLRKALGSHDIVVIEGERYRISPEVDQWFDVAAFEREMGVLLREDAAGVSVERLEEALALYRGGFLEGEVAGDWHLEVHDRVRRLYVDGLSTLADLRMDRGDLTAAIEALERLVQLEDLREDAYRRLMVCLSRSGRRDRALQHYGRLVTLLRDELDAEPEDETSELAERIREAMAV